MKRKENVGLREYRRSDMQHYLIWGNDPEVMQYVGGYLPLTEMAEEKWIETLPDRTNSDVNFIIVAFDGDTEMPIGSIGLNHLNTKDRNATFGIVIGEKDYWSHGYGTRAGGLLMDYGFDQLNLHRINSYVFEFNERSQRMHRALGFVEEGRQRHRIYVNGSYYDAVVFGLLREDWEKNKQGKGKADD